MMRKGHPCEDLYPNEYFKDGITNGAQWYNVAGEPYSARVCGMPCSGDPATNIAVVLCKEHLSAFSLAQQFNRFNMFLISFGFYYIK